MCFSIIVYLNYFLVCIFIYFVIIYYVFIAKGRTNVELREQFTLASGVSQSMTPFKTRANTSPKQFCIWRTKDQPILPYNRSHHKGKVQK